MFESEGKAEVGSNNETTQIIVMSTSCKCKCTLIPQNCSLHNKFNLKPGNGCTYMYFIKDKAEVQ